MVFYCFRADKWVDSGWANAVVIDAVCRKRELFGSFDCGKV
jgi:hypothetical protein